eukprot:CAMPEP_0184290318 /NCGR_PEP_ID=MMETSP1049-20130417/2615_1 /TAXON_ID=77928 /ORGANISM="Proteomonas sulcata, Strain CCMP704" /LENGTH=100 /DNA_ID=CAMNT_0026597453 /DNA_START=389 /DNA_END=691 /DNA_ORIENTATION=+
MASEIAPSDFIDKSFSECPWLMFSPSSATEFKESLESSLSMGGSVGKAAASMSSLPMSWPCWETLIDARPSPTMRLRGSALLKNDSGKLAKLLYAVCWKD